MQETQIADLEALFLALADKTRLKLLELMADGPAAVGLLVERLNESQPKVSRHLAYLRNVGIVATRRDGKQIYYGIKYPADPLIRHVLDTVIHSISTAETERNDGRLNETDIFAEYASELGQHMHADVYVADDDDADLEGDVVEITDGSGGKDELDVFLL